MAGLVTIAKIGEVPPGSLKKAEADGQEIALANVGGTFYAIGDECTHRGCSLSEGELDGDQLTCPCHGSVFSVRTGEPSHPPATEAAAIYQVRVEGDEVKVST